MKRIRTLFGQFRSMNKKEFIDSFSRYEYPEVSITIEVPVEGASRLCNNFSISSKEKTACLRYDRKKRIWRLWAPRVFSFETVIKDGIDQKYLKTKYRWEDLFPAFVRKVEEQKKQGAAVIRLHMHYTQLTGARISAAA